jgi:hypothetical protein
MLSGVNAGTRAVSLTTAFFLACAFRANDFFGDSKRKNRFRSFSLVEHSSNESSPAAQRVLATACCFLGPALVGDAMLLFDVSVLPCCWIDRKAEFSIRNQQQAV